MRGIRKHTKQVSHKKQNKYNKENKNIIKICIENINKFACYCLCVNFSLYSQLRVLQHIDFFAVCIKHFFQLLN